MQLIPGQGFYKGSDFDKLQKEYIAMKELQFQQKISKFNIKSLDVIINEIQDKINNYDNIEEVKDLAKLTSKYFCFLPTDIENKQLLNI
ncbi:MAG: hypothetical protein AAFO15_00200 [Pseudomonadota bacterium]